MANPSPSQARSLIVAADDDLLRARLRAILQPLDVTVREASDGWELMSLLLATSVPVDLVISDLRLLSRSGLEALGPARAAGIDVPFLLLASASNLAIHTAAARLGAAILEKPVVPGRLIAWVQHLCPAASAACPDPGVA